MIRKHDHKYQLVAKSTGKVLGTFPTKAKAQAQEAAIQISKAKAAKAAKSKK